MKRVTIVLEVLFIIGLLSVAVLASPLMVLWLTFKWSMSRRRCGR